MIFEWDPEKRKKNILERKIDFIDAALVWDNPMRQERIDHRKEYGGIRYQTIGRVRFGILFVVYTARVNVDGEDVIRIISVRKQAKEIKWSMNQKLSILGELND